MASDDKQAAVEKLKAEGNALHLKGDHSAARAKYTEAIKLDPENAILYANRAAAYIALKQHLDAAKDAQTAVKLDANYGKAWARLGKSTYELHLLDQSISAWQEALKSLPAENLSDQETQLKTQFEEGLKLAEDQTKYFADVEGAQNRLVVVPSDRMNQLPWIKALNLEDVLTANNVLNTCAWPLMNAYKDFSEGVRYMKQIKKTPQGIQANLNALQSIMGGILRDPRVFHMDSADWLDQLQLQVQLELTAFEGWPTGGPESVKADALKLQQDKGWKAMRMAVGATVRAWFFRAYLAHAARDWDGAMEYYNSIVDVLDWGAATWPDVPSAERGYMFDKTFVRAVRRIRMEAYLGALRTSEEDDEEDPKYNVEELMEMANSMVEETTKNVPKDGDQDANMDKGAWYSFHVYPVADAHAMLGAVFLQQGLSAKQEQDTEEAEKMLTAAARFYKQAAGMYPPDDEQFPFFLKIVFEAEWHRGRPLSETIPLVERIRKALPAVDKIWAYNPFGRLKEHMRELAIWEERAFAGLLEDRFTMETPSSDIPLFN